MAQQITQNQEWTGDKVDNFYDSKSCVLYFRSFTSLFLGWVLNKTDDARQVRDFRGLEILSCGLIHQCTVMVLLFGFPWDCVGCVPPLLFAGRFFATNIPVAVFALFISMTVDLKKLSNTKFNYYYLWGYHFGHVFTFQRTYYTFLVAKGWKYWLISMLMFNFTGIF